MSDYTEEALKNILQEVTLTQNIRNWTYSLKKFDKIAQNYFCIVIPAVIKSDDTELNLVLKLAPTDERFRISGAITMMFKKEIFVYTEILAEYLKLQKNFSEGSTFIAPLCYHTCEDYCKEVIVLQDMCAQGYSPYVDQQFLNVDHAIVSIVSLAKFHALGCIVAIKNPQFYEKIREVCVPLSGDTDQRYMTILQDRLRKAIEKFQDTKYVNLFEKLLENCATFIVKTCDNVKKTTICHGDMWKENIMYKYDDNKPTSACIIDFQTAGISSQAYDVLYLITSSTDKNLRNDNYNKLLTLYYDTFKTVLGEASINASDVYSIEDFHFDLKVVAPSCLITANTAFWLANGLQEEGHVKSKTVFRNENERRQAVERYKLIISNIVDDFCSYGFMEL